ncbi:MAG: hypothetical protein AMJ84_00365 [Acidithiobacillales bacterium SM23_46]|nr:MAG: hypothetical protein AMJ84_00365 [Acidithiobacillales bacterium SM23_46]
MIVVGVWESGFTDEQLFIEWRMWKQTISAYQIRDWRMVGNVPGCGAYQEFDRIEDAIADIAEHRRIFLIPGARQTVNEIRAVDNPALIFGSYDENLHRLVTPPSQAVRIPTPQDTDMFAAACLPLVLHHVY